MFSISHQDSGYSLKIHRDIGSEESEDYTWVIILENGEPNLIVLNQEELLSLKRYIDKELENG